MAWMTPLVPALSICFMAAAAATSASVPVSAAVRAALTRVRNSERTARLRMRRFSFWRFRLIWLLMLATETHTSFWMLERSGDGLVGRMP